MGTIVPGLPLLLGQQVEVGGGLGSRGMPLAVMLIPLGALLIVIGLPVVLGIRAEVRKREMEHAERMRAIELGRPLPVAEGWWTPARTAVGIGVGVPIGVFLIGVGAAAEVESAAPFIWPSAGAVGLAAVICGTILAARLPSARSNPSAPDPRSKPYVDPDAFDLAEHRHA